MTGNTRLMSSAVLTTLMICLHLGRLGGMREVEDAHDAVPAGHRIGMVRRSRGARGLVEFGKEPVGQGHLIRGTLRRQGRVCGIDRNRAKVPDGAKHVDHLLESGRRLGIGEMVNPRPVLGPGGNGEQCQYSNAEFAHGNSSLRY